MPAGVVLTNDVEEEHGCVVLALIEEEAAGARSEVHRAACAGERSTGSDVRHRMTDTGSEGTEVSKRAS